MSRSGTLGFEFDVTSILRFLCILFTKVFDLVKIVTFKIGTLIYQIHYSSFVPFILSYFQNLK